MGDGMEDGMDSWEGPRRFAVVGSGHRATPFVRALAFDQPEVGVVIAWCEPDPRRMDDHDEILREAGHVPPVRYAPDEFAALLDEQRPDVVVVTSPDATHHRYVVPALRAGCDVVVEQPLTTQLGPAREIAAAAVDAKGELITTFPYRYAPCNVELRRVIADGEVGAVTSVHVEWLIDTVHGAGRDRWRHREKVTSGGLLVHQASHHFDLVNWWLDDVPAVVQALGALWLHGTDDVRAGAVTGRPAQSADAAGAPDDPHRPGLADDNLGVLVGYASGAMLTYSLNAHAPWEGYRVAVNGTDGRAELDVVEHGYVRSECAASAPAPPGDHHGGELNPRPPGERLLVQRRGELARLVPIGAGEAAHGDGPLIDDVLRRGQPRDPIGRRADYRDGLRATAVGIAANRSIATGAPVELASLGLPLDRGGTLPRPLRADGGRP
jgi:predicted dehydrogenase